LGKIGRRISQVGLGTWPLAGNVGIGGYGSADPELAEATIHAALAAGISLFETANVYGDGFAERLLGRLVPDADESNVICTKGGFRQFKKTGAFQPRELKNEFEASRERLRRETIDIYLLHNPPAYLIGLSELYRPILELKDHGWIEYIGIAVAYVQDAWLALDRPEVEVIQLPYNFMQFDAEQGLLHRAHQQGKGIIARETLANGLLTGRYHRESCFPDGDFRQTLPEHIWTAVSEAHGIFNSYRRASESWVDFALRYVLDRPEISCAIVGARTPEHVQNLVKAGTIVSSPAGHEEG
jgi:aryl-alcohol dehydrogenase-like predicted oxidoreductase